jgi:hypothetical protein
VAAAANAVRRTGTLEREKARAEDVAKYEAVSRSAHVWPSLYVRLEEQLDELFIAV